MTGERLSAYCFSGGGEHPPNVLAARDFSWLKRFGLYFMIYLAHLDVDVITMKCIHNKNNDSANVKSSAG